MARQGYRGAYQTVAGSCFRRRQARDERPNEITTLPIRASFCM